MSFSAYTSPTLVRALYADSTRIAARGGFLKQYSNRKLSVRDVARMLTADLPHRHVLDFGCGNGSFLKSLIQDPRVETAYALDIVRHEDLAAMSDRVTYLDVADGLPDFVARLDVIYCMNVLYHMTRAQAAASIQWMADRLGNSRSLLLTTKSGDNFPAFRAVLDRLGLEYPDEADECTFCSENAMELVAATLPPDQFSITEFPLTTQIVTPDAGAVVRYMLSNQRFAGLADHHHMIVSEMIKIPLVLDTYRETIILATKVAGG